MVSAISSRLVLAAPTMRRETTVISESKKETSSQQKMRKLEHMYTTLIHVFGDSEIQWDMLRFNVFRPVSFWNIFVKCLRLQRNQCLNYVSKTFTNSLPQNEFVPNPCFPQKQRHVPNPCSPPKPIPVTLHWNLHQSSPNQIFTTTILRNEIMNDANKKCMP